MARNHPVSFPWFPSDYLSSSRTAAMLPEQEGAYRRLLDYCWIEPTCCIAADDASLAMMTKLGSRWRKLKEAVLACFEPCPEHGDRITNPKLYQLRQEDAAYRDAQSESGARGAKTRWRKNSTRHIKLTESPSPADGEPIVSPMATGMANDSSPSPIPSSSSEIPKKESQSETKTRARTIPGDFAANAGHAKRAADLGLSLADELNAFREHALATGRKLVNWDAGFSLWLRRSPEFKRPGGSNGQFPRPSVRPAVESADPYAAAEARQAEQRARLAAARGSTDVS